MSSSLTKPTAVIAGLGNGSGTGAATARLLASKGYRVALIGRSRPSATANKSSLDGIVDSIAGIGGEVAAFPVAAYDPEGLSGAFKEIEERWPKSIRFALFNAAHAPFEKLLDVTAETLKMGVETSIFGAFAFGQEVVKAILASTGEKEEEEGHRGTLIFTGGSASIKGVANSAAQSAGKFGTRGISQSIAREYASKGIHTAHVIIDGYILTDMIKGWVQDEAKLNDPRRMLRPESIAKTYWFLHEQDPSAWTQELELV